MPQNPVDTLLFVSQLVAGEGITITPDHGTGIVTVAAGATETTQVGTLLASQLVVSGNASLATTQVGGLLSAAALSLSGNAALATTQIGTLTAIQIANTATFTANGVSQVTVSVGGLTATSVAAFGLVTAGGTVGSPHMASPPDTVHGTVTVQSQASDTSTWRITILS